MSRIYGGDIETDNDGKTAWIVQWAITNNNEVYTGRNLESLAGRLTWLATRRDATYLYFHNLKYDLSFIKYALSAVCDASNTSPLIMMRDRNPIAINLTPIDKSRRGTLHIRDSLKKFQGNLASLARVVGLEKLDGFDFYRGWSDDVDFDDPDNWEYVIQDARIVAVAMQQLHALGNGRATTSSDAWSHAKTIARQHSDGRPGTSNHNWQNWFPSLSYELDALLRRGYVGGINISEHVGINRGQITVSDVNSMYPAVMMYDPLPVGLPTVTTTRPDGALYVVHGDFKLKLKNGWIPWWIFKSVADKEEGVELGRPVVETTRYHTMTLTSVDYKNLCRSYDVTLRPGCEPQYLVFKSRVGLMSDYINTHMRDKNNAVRGSMEYNRAKLMLNGLYGRFALNPMGQTTTMTTLDSGIVDWIRTPELTSHHDAYLPFGMFVTSHAHTRLLDYVEAVGPENVIHCDTDSVIHYGGRADGVKYGDELGEWDVENTPKVVYEGGFKRYVLQLTDNPASTKDYKIAAAGVPPQTRWEIYDNPEIIITDAELGHREYRVNTPWLRDELRKQGLDPDKLNTCKLLPREVLGGTILRETTHKLQDAFNFGVR